MKVCPGCDLAFDIVKGHGGNNRIYCYSCVPANISKDERRKLHHNILRQKSDKLKLAKGCTICKYNKCARALEWHHTEDDKLHDPSNALKRSWEAYLLEISTCTLLCANCHREEHERLNISE